MDFDHTPTRLLSQEPGSSILAAMRQIGKTLWLAGGLAFWLVAADAQSGFALKDGDRVVFYGDSITDQRLYTTFTETYVVTRFPNRNITFVHSGWGGDRVTGGGGGPIDIRLKRDVLAYRPTVMTIMLGMNDGAVRPFDQETFRIYADGYRHIVQSVKAANPGIRITAILPSPYDDVTRPSLFEGGYNAVLVRYGQFLKELADREKLTVADLNTPVVASLVKARAADPELARKIVPDRVHPGPGGHLLMAEALLKAWGAPALVSAVEIDASTRQVLRSENTAITGLETDSTVRWMETDQALPMPFDLTDTTLALAVRSSDFIEALDRQSLTVRGLRAPRYSLRIDGEPVRSLTKEQLAQGINLAELPTPMMRQAREVHALTLKHNNVHFARWRQVEVPLQEEHVARKQEAMNALDALEAELVGLQRAAARPRARRYELVPDNSAAN